MPHYLHVIDRRAANWSALGAVATLLQSSSGNQDAHEALVRGRIDSWDRAEIAGIPAYTEGKARANADLCAIAWDSVSVRWCASRGIEFTSAPTSIPVDRRRFEEVDRIGFRKRLGISEHESVVAFNTGDMHREAIEYVYVRAAALDLAGQPAAWIALHPLSHDSDFAASLQRIGASSRIIAPALAPWSILATADAAVINSDDAHGDDLRRWAEASGAPVMAMHNTLENDPRRQRFESSRAAFAALRRPSRAPEPPTTTDTTFDDFLASLLRDAAAAAPIQS